MKKHTLSTRMLVAVLSICLIVTFIPFSSVSAETKASTSAGQDTLNNSMEYLVNECGQRLYGSPNEDKAAAFVKSQFESFGYKDVEWAKIDQSSTNYVGRLVFKDGSPDILGTPYPTTPTNGNFSDLRGKIVDLGTDTAYAVPAGTTGNIVGAVRFDGAPTLAAVNDIITAVKSNSGITLTGLLISRNGGTVRNQNTVPSITDPADLGNPKAPIVPAVPCITMPNKFLQKAIDDAASFDYGERYTKRKTNAVIATKPAPGGNPDAIIIVSSHLDCVLASPGASDNASGVAANIELAKRFADADLGNIEVRFAAVGAEDGGGMLGSIYVRNSLTEEQKAISINLNMDMLCSPLPYVSGGTPYPLNAVSMDINPQPLAFNLPAFLITDTAKSVSWASGIENVRIYRYGSSDHVQFANVGIDAASMIIATNDTDDIENENHSAQDNLIENYSYDRLLTCTNLMANGIQKAADLQLSKRALFSVKDMGSHKQISLKNADQLFKAYNKVTATLTGDNGAYKVAFTKTKPYVNGLPAYDTFTASDVMAYGSGNADNLDADRNAQYSEFKTALSPTVKEVIEYKLTSQATTGGKASGSGMYEEGSSVTLKATPSSKYRFVGWYDGTTKLSGNWSYNYTIVKNVTITAKFAKIGTPAVTAKALKGHKAKISWSKVTGAYQYQVYRSTSKTGKYSKVGTVSSSKTSFTDTKLKAGKKYYYKVRVVCKAGVTTYGDFSKIKSIKAKK